MTTAVSHEGYRLIVFDLDGTLIDSRRDLADAANVTLGEYGLSFLPTDTIAAMIGEGATVLLERAFGAHGRATPEGALEVFLRAYDSRLIVHTRPYDGIVDVVARLAERSRVAVLTNKPLGPTEKLLDHFALAPHVFRAIGGDGPFPRKPHPAGLRALMRAASAQPSETVMVGDSWVDHEAAQRAGVRACLVRYGFGFAQIPAERLRGDEIIVARPEDLAGLRS